MDQAKRLKELERENSRLKRLNGYDEAFNGKLRDQLLDGEIFYTLREAKVLLERWRWHYDHVRPRSSLGFRPPAPQAALPGRGARTHIDSGTGSRGQVTAAGFTDEEHPSNSSQLDLGAGQFLFTIDEGVSEVRVADQVR